MHPLAVRHAACGDGRSEQGMNKANTDGPERRKVRCPAHAQAVHSGRDFSEAVALPAQCNGRWRKASPLNSGRRCLSPAPSRIGDQPPDSPTAAGQHSDWCDLFVFGPGRRFVAED